MKTIKVQIEENQICSGALAEQIIESKFKKLVFDRQEYKTKRTLIKLILIGKNWQNKQVKLPYFFKERLNAWQICDVHEPRLHHNIFRGFYYKID